MIELLLLNINQSLLVIDLVYVIRMLPVEIFYQDEILEILPAASTIFFSACLLSFPPALLLRPPAAPSCLHLPRKMYLGTALGRSHAEIFSTVSKPHAHFLTHVMVSINDANTFSAPSLAFAISLH